MFLKEALLLLAGLAAGSTVAAGVYAFLVVIGVYPRLIGKTATATKGKIFLYETIIALGGLFGNVVDLFTEKVKQLTGSFLRIAWPAAMPEAELWQKAAEGGGRTGAGAGFLVMLGNVSEQLLLAAAGTFLWYFCRLPRHVAGRDIESPAGAEPPPASGSGAAISPSRDCGGEMCGFAVLFLIWNWKTVEERRNHGSQKRSI